MFPWQGFVPRTLAEVTEVVMKAIRTRHARHYLLAAFIGVALLGLHETLQPDRAQSACRSDGEAISCAYPPAAHLGVLDSPF